MNVAKQWRKDEGEGECLTFGLEGWIGGIKVRFPYSLIYMNFQVLCFYRLPSKQFVLQLI